MDESTTISRVDTALYTTVEDAVLMMDIDTGCYFELSPTGARIWQLLETPQTLTSLCSRLCAQYDVTEDRCRAEAEAFVMEMNRLGVVKFN